MDILNFISWIRGGRVVTTVNPAQTLLPVGLKDNRRDDGYLAGAISVEDLVTQLTPTPTYKVFTALLTQSGGDGPDNIVSGNTIIGVTYQIDGSIEGDDFRNIGGPLITYNNEFQNYYFLATGTTPTVWTNGTSLNFNTGAPVATVLENTIGNIWFTYSGDPGLYSAKSNDLFSLNKTMCSLSSSLFGGGADFNSNLIFYSSVGSNNDINIISSSGGTYTNDQLSNTPIEIRVYN